MSKRILAIDPGTYCGYAWIDVSYPVPNSLQAIPAQSGVWDLSVKRHEGGGMRFLRLKKHLIEVEPDLIIYEEVRGHKGTSASHIYGGIVGQIQLFGEEHDVNYVAIPVGTIKKKATGKGNANKEAMVAAANGMFGCDLSDAKSSKDDNIADALWLLQIGIDEYADALEGT